MRRTIAFTSMLVLLTAAAAGQYTSWSAPVNLGPLVNSPYVDSCVSVSKNGLSLFFFSNRYASNPSAPWRLYVATRGSVEEPWGLPVEIVGFNDGYGASCPALSPDEHRLFFSSGRPGGCGGNDIWVSRRHDRTDDFSWESPTNVGCVTNSPQGEVVPTVFEDETGAEVLVFTSGRPGGPGGGDIWQSRMGSDGAFGPASLDAELSTPYTDHVAIRRDGLEAVVSSWRPGGPGNGDLWTTDRESTGDPWPAPVLIPIVNTPSFDGGRMSFSFDGRALYFTSDRPGGYGYRDLYVITREKLRR